MDVDADVQGRVIHLRRPGQHDDFAHPNAVIVQLGPDSYLCVAGFTPGKDKYEAARQAEHRIGVWGPAFAVEIDHAKHLTPVNPQLSLHVCGYICHTAELMTTTQLSVGREWGPLSRVAINEIANGLLEREKTRPFLGKRVVEALKKLLGQP